MSCVRQQGYGGSSGRRWRCATSASSRPGHAATMLGPSGCGKTTAPDDAGLERRARQHLIVVATSPDRAGRAKRTCVQSYALFPHMECSPTSPTPEVSKRREGRGEGAGRTPWPRRPEGFDARMPSQLTAASSSGFARARARAEPAVLRRRRCPTSTPPGRSSEEIRARSSASADRATSHAGEAIAVSDRNHVMDNGATPDRIADELYERPSESSPLHGEAMLFDATLRADGGPARPLASRQRRAALRPGSGPGAKGRGQDEPGASCGGRGRARGDRAKAGLLANREYTFAFRRRSSSLSGGGANPATRRARGSSPRRRGGRSCRDKADPSR